MVKYLHIFAMFIIINIQQIESFIINKRSTKGNGFRPSHKTCLDFCVFTNCNMGRCILDDNTCFASCICQPNFTGRWCENEMSDTDQKNNSVILIMPSRKHTTTAVDRQSSNNSSSDLNTNILFSLDTVTVPNIINQTEINNDELLKNETDYKYPENFESRRESWIECKETCFLGGKCVEINGSYNCSNIDHRCAPGLECKHGVCQKGFTENRQNFKCLCEYGWIGTFCSERCFKDCGMLGQCAITDKKSGTTSCVCDPHYSGPHCSVRIVTPVDDEVTFHWYVIGACAGIGTVLIVMLVLLPYCIWKKRRSFIMKIIHYFQNYEDDDGKTYDAFLSYKSSKTDEDFILKQLYPKLEIEMGYKLCLHFRDFTPGDVIANNIIRAVEDSRRTILVISQNYIESEWCRMEYQKAQHEMLKMKHKIIPVILEDISHLKIDKNLKSIINSITYIEWPGESDSKKLERFWKQLKLSMPKKQVPLPSNAMPSIISSSSTTLETSSSNCSSIHSVHPCDSVLESNNSDDTVSQYSSKRIRTLLGNPFRLNITSDNFKRLSRTCSKDSGISSPITASPSSVSPLINKDINPLLPRKQIDIRHNNSKGLLFKHGYQNKINEVCDLYNNVICEDGTYVEKHSSDISNIPDVCKMASKENNEVFNITTQDIPHTSPSENGHISNVCQTCILKQEVSNEFVNEPNIISMTNCDTCVLHHDDVDDNIRQFVEDKRHKIVKDKVLNKSQQLTNSDKIKTI